MENLRLCILDIIKKDEEYIAEYDQMVSELKTEENKARWMPFYEAILGFKKREIVKYKNVAEDYGITL